MLASEVGQGGILRRNPPSKTRLGRPSDGDALACIIPGYGDIKADKVAESGWRYIRQTTVRGEVANRIRGFRS